MPIFSEIKREVVMYVVEQTRTSSSRGAGPVSQLWLAPVVKKTRADLGWRCCGGIQRAVMNYG